MRLLKNEPESQGLQQSLKSNGALIHRSGACALPGRGVLWTQWGATLPKPLVCSAGKDTRSASALSSEANLFPPERRRTAIAIFHMPVQIIKRSKAKSAVGAAAYRSGTKMTNEWDGLYP